jgi:ADP-heptose:LPS heptosyltransferase
MLGRGNTIRSILVLKLDHIGDFIQSLDAQLYLRSAFPNATIDLACGPWNVELARSTKIFDNIYSINFFDERADGNHPSPSPMMVSNLQGRRWDLVIDLRQDPDTRILLRFIEADWKAGFDSPGNDDLMTLRVPQCHISMADTHLGVNQSVVMLRLIHSVVDLFFPRESVRAVLLDEVSIQPQIDLTRATGRHLIVCNTSSGRLVKNWPLDKFKSLIAWLATDVDCVVVLLGDEAQVNDATEIVAFCSSSNVISAVGKTTIPEAIGIIARASVYIGNDTGLTHVAARLGVQSVVLFSGVDPTAKYAPLGTSTTILTFPVPCSPCHIIHLKDCVGARACMMNISLSAVQTVVLKHLIVAPVYEGSLERTPSFGAKSSAIGRRTGYNSHFSTWIESHQSEIPQRYSQNCERYLAKGGRLDIQGLLRGFTKGNKNNRGDLNRFYTLALIFDQIMKEQTLGDIAELGVYKGNTAYMLASFARRIGVTAYLLDTFEGFDDADLEGMDANKAMQFFDTSLEAVQSLVGSASVAFIKGYFPDSSARIPHGTQFCLVHIDCDLYAPFKAALDYFYPRMAPGGFMIMHDYASLHWDGAERAIDEFFSGKPESIVPVADGSGTVIVRKAKRADEEHDWITQERTNGFANAWVHANSHPVDNFLIDGWSHPEPWGTWGLGDSHTLSLLLFEPPPAIDLAVESQLPLIPGRERGWVDVRAHGRHLTRWVYNHECNVAVRTLRLPRSLMIPMGKGLFTIKIEFFPDSSKSPHDLDQKYAETRPLGMGLLRFRQRSLGENEVY